MDSVKSHNTVLTVGLLSIGLGIWTVLQTPTLILSPWFLVALYLPVAFVISYLIGFLIKKITKSNWATSTFAFALLTIASLSLFISQYRPSYTVEVPSQFEGEVRLLLSTSEENKLKLNKYGIGYLNERTYRNGFRTSIVRDGEDITDSVIRYATGSFVTSTTNEYRLDYFSFYIPGNGKVKSKETIALDSLIKIKAVDANLLKKKY